MYVKDIVRDFYEVLLGQHVLLLVNYDIDAICTCKILQWLFQSEDVMYTLVPVLGVSDLITAFHDHLQDMKYVILVNCGGTIDLVDLVEPDENVVIFVIDSHRPSDLCNIYSLSQIRLVALPGDDEEIPQFSDVFEGSDDEEENEDEGEADVNSDDEDYEGRQAKKMRLAEEKMIKRRNKRQWEENKNRIVFEYSQFTYFGRCSSIITFELLWKISKGNIDVLWWAIVGLTSYLILGDSSYDMYLEEVQNLRKYVDELSKKKSNLLNGELLASHDETSSSSRNGTFLAISPETDMNLAIYRHWTVEASLRHSMFTAVHLKLWTKRGEQRLHQLLAEMGLPLVQSKQLFSSMDINLRHEFQDMMTKTAESYNMNNFVFSSFVLQYGFRGKFYASDYVYSLIALMNSSCGEKPRVDCFLEALDCLSRQKRDLLESGIEGAKTILISLFRQVKIFMDMKQVFSAGSFLYFVIQDGTVEAQYFSNPLCLTMLSRFMLRAYMQVGSRRKTNKLPLIASAPYEPGTQTCLIVGVPPITEFTNRNFFGKAFEQAAKQINCTIEMDYFDTNIVRMKVEDRSKFFDSLTALLG